MLKKIIFTITAIELCACSIGPHVKTIDPSINPADRHIWIQEDDEDIEKRRLRQVHLDGITKEIETLFINLENLAPEENNMPGDISNMCTFPNPLHTLRHICPSFCSDKEPQGDIVREIDMNNAQSIAGEISINNETFDRRSLNFSNNFALYKVDNNYSDTNKKGEITISNKSNLYDYGLQFVFMSISLEGVKIEVEKEIGEIRKYVKLNLE